MCNIDVVEDEHTCSKTGEWKFVSKSQLPTDHV